VVKLRRGFKKEAEEYSKELRLELGLQVHNPINPMILATHLCVPVYELSSHPLISDEVKIYFATAGSSDFSATTLPDGTYRAILHNDYQHINRQNSNITHEIAHILLGHPPKPPMICDSCRNFDPVMEREANELGFILLVPKVAALFAVEAIGNIDRAALHYGVSRSLMSYRIKITDVRRWAANRARNGSTCMLA